MIGRLFAQDAALYADLIMDKPENFRRDWKFEAKRMKKRYNFLKKAIAKGLLMLSIKWENGLGSIQINSCRKVVSYCNKLMIYDMYKIKVRLIFTTLLFFDLLSCQA